MALISDSVALSQICKTIDTGLVYRTVCLFTAAFAVTDLYCLMTEVMCTNDVRMFAVNYSAAAIETVIVDRSY